MREATLKLTPLGFHVGMEADGSLTECPDVKLFDHCRQFVEFKFDQVVGRLIPERKYFFYDDQTKTLYLPRYNLSEFVGYLKSRDVKAKLVELSTQLGAPVTIDLIDGFKPKSDVQADAIAFASNSDMTKALRPIAIQPGAGKDLDINTLVRIPGGWKRMGDIVENEYVISQDGTPTRVTGVFPQGVKKTWRITFEDGRKIIAGADHQWKVKKGGQKVWTTSTTLGVLSDLCIGTQVFIPTCLPEDKSLDHIEEKISKLSHYVDTRSQNGGSEKLDEMIQEIVWALGGICRKSGSGLEINFDNDLLEIISIEPVEDRETQCISVEHPSRLYVVENYIVTHNTATSIVAISKIGRRALICVPFMLEQWVKSIKKFTKLKDDDIYVIQGMASFAKLMARIDKSLHPKIIIISIPTLRMYADGAENYHNFPNFDKLCDHLKIGVRVVDEVHLNFQTNLLFDMRMNNAVTIPLTATFDNSSQSVKIIFENHYPRRERFGENHYKRYVDVYAYGYRLGFTPPSNAYRGREGYSHTKFETWLLAKKNRRVLEDIKSRVYAPIINSHYINKADPKEKLLVLAATVEMCKNLKESYTEDYADKKSSIYIGGTKDEVLDENDIIVSTPRSAGTGRDIKDLRTTLMTVSVRSSPLNKQVMGRLRELPSGNTPEYVYCHCLDIPQHVSHAEFRKEILEPLSKTFTTATLS